MSCVCTSVGQSLVYHLSDLRGMSLWYDKFGVLGLSTAALQQAVNAAGSFMLKASELQQLVINSQASLLSADKELHRSLF